jgi:nitrite reductase/ring-hydroxylating ferredoxin subunit
MARWVAICRASEVPAGQTRAYPLPGLRFPILIAHLSGGRFVASSAICPHEDVSLEGGDLYGTILTCPGHGYEFDLETGRCEHDPSLRLRRFRVEVEEDQVRVLLDLLGTSI